MPVLDSQNNCTRIYEDDKQNAAHFKDAPDPNSTSTLHSPQIALKFPGGSSKSGQLASSHGPPAPATTTGGDGGLLAAPSGGITNMATSSHVE